MPLTERSVSGRATGVIGGVALIVVLTLAGSPATAAPGDEHLDGLEYVALGDSYASGFGLGSPVVGAPHDDCEQSTLNYPRLVAAEFNLSLTDASCSGAIIANIATTPQVIVGPPSTPLPLQNSYLSATTDIVTLSIAGNDLGYVPVMTACAALSASGPVVGTSLPLLTSLDCKALFAPGGIDTLSAMVAGVIEPELTTALANIAAAAPNAEIFLVGYPALTPDVGSVPLGAEGCFRSAVNLGLPLTFNANAYPYTLVDVPYLHEVEVALDSMFASVATAAGAVYVPMLTQTSAHSPCAASAEQWVNGLTVTSLDLGTGAVELEPGALHPNAAGVAFMTAQVQDAIRAAIPAPADPEPNPGGTPGLAATGADTGQLGLVGVLALLAGALALGWRRSLAHAR